MAESVMVKLAVQLPPNEGTQLHPTSAAHLHVNALTSVCTLCFHYGSYGSNVMPNAQSSIQLIQPPLKSVRYTHRSCTAQHQTMR